MADIEKWSHLLVGLLCVTNALTLPSERKAPKLEMSEGGMKDSRGLVVSTDHTSEGKSVRFFGGMPSFGNPNTGLFQGPLGYNMGGFPSYPYPPPYGYMGGPMNFGGYYPTSPNFYGNSFGGYSTQQQQQQQQQMSQMGAGSAGVGGFQPPFGG
ncbi:hypothetical protein ONE63_010627 [Megalurothrips usitatus]|uniref:Uncharacterized protein n=1 Tax=Megalurothrips usitatus TaxID=439358 RepID=A0AAV7XGI8_9NEOP|nr:hypothetical protein ONE63_010627 [Megalurothrips usitatus]